MCENELEISEIELERLSEHEKKLLDYELKFIIRIVDNILSFFLISLILTLIIQICRQL